MRGVDGCFDATMMISHARDAKRDVRFTAASEVEGVKRHLSRRLADGLSSQQPHRRPGDAGSPDGTFATSTLFQSSANNAFGRGALSQFSIALLVAPRRVEVPCFMGASR